MTKMEEELNSFGDKEFDPKKWINKAWSASGNQEKQIFVNDSVARLQQYMKQLTQQLDDTTFKIVHSMSDTVQQASGLQADSEELRQELGHLEQKVHGVEEQTGMFIEGLQRIDQLKSRLENAAAALRESDKWAALATSLEEVLESGVPTQSDKLAELAEQVAAMTASLEVLSDSTDYESKRLQLETLFNRLEAAISPPLIEALTQMDANRTRVYVWLFTGMGRATAACRCWRRAAAARLASSWRRSDSCSVPALTALLTRDADTQVEWLTNVLRTETPLAELIRLYTDLLLSLEPSPTKVVSANLKLCSTPDEGITQLIELKRQVDEFIVCIKKVIAAPSQNKEPLLPAVLKELGRAAYAPLRQLAPRYSELQAQALLAHLESPLLQQEELLEHSRAILTMAERCDAWLSDAYNNARRVAGAACYPYYVPAVEAFISRLSEHVSSHSRCIESTFLSSVAGGQTAGVLSPTFPAALVLETAVAFILHTLADRQKKEREDQGTQPATPLDDMAALLLSRETRGKLEARGEALACTGALLRAKEQLRALARAVLRSPVDAQLDKIPQLSVWSDNDALSTDLPDFALSPQEYITEIGQYLMTLPQHLELHLSEKQAPWQFLSEVCTHTCDVYADKILNIRHMDALGTKRCLTDILYLSSVVEDLGTTLTPSLRNLEKSLRAAAPAPDRTDATD